MSRSTKPKPFKIEIRRDPPTKRHPEGDIDEIVGRGFLHLERMSPSHFCLLFYAATGETLCLDIGPTRRGNCSRLPHVGASVSWHEWQPSKRTRRVR